MAIIRLKVSLGTGYAGAFHDDILEIEAPDDWIYDEIEKECEEAFQQWAWERLDGHWEILEDENE